MSRRGWIILQAGTCGAIAITAVTSFFFTPCTTLELNESNWLVALAYEGRARVFWFHSDFDRFRVKKDSDSQILEIRSVSRGTVLPPEVCGPPEPPGFRRLIPLGTRRQLPAFGGLWRGELLWYYVAIPFPNDATRRANVNSSFVRFPLWLPIGLLIVSPLRRIMRERLVTWRVRSNRCPKCGYRLDGLLNARCPECGSLVANSAVPPLQLSDLRAD